jgi:dodecin
LWIAAVSSGLSDDQRHDRDQEDEQNDSPSDIDAGSENEDIHQAAPAETSCRTYAGPIMAHRYPVRGASERGIRRKVRSTSVPVRHCGKTPQTDDEEGAAMPVARVTEISATSSQSFEDAIRDGLDRANTTLRNVKSAWIKEQQVRLEGGSISEYQVNMLVTFVLDD